MNTKTRTGTNKFVSLKKAEEYYAAYGYSREEVRAKLANREIDICPGKLQPNEFVDTDGRIWQEN